MFTLKFFYNAVVFLLCGLSWHITNADEASKSGNLDSIIAEALNAGQKNIKIASGVYKLGAKGGAILKFQGLEDVTIDATGAELVCLNTTQAIFISKCKNFTLKGLSIDYNPLPFTQGKITEISKDGEEWTVEIFDGYSRPSSVRDFKLEVYNPQTLRLRTWDIFSFESKPISEKLLKIVIKQKRSLQMRQERVGDYITIASTNIERSSPHAIVLDDCENTRLENISLYASNCFGYFEKDCKNSVYINCSLDKRPLDTDIVKRAIPRLRSGNADGFHSKFSKFGPSYINCKSMWNGDDSVAINGKYFLLLSSEKNKLKIASLSGDNFNIDTNDTLEIFSTSGKVSYAKVSSVSSVSAMTEFEEDWVVKNIVKHTVLNNRKFAPKRMRTCVVEIEQNVDNLLPASLVCAANKIGEGFKIIGGIYGNHRSRGLIIKSGMGVIKGVKIVGARMASILCAPEAYWFEAGHSRNLAIEDCDIECGMQEAIRIESKPMACAKYSPSGAHSNIQIKNNRIKHYYSPSMLLTSISNLSLQANKVELQSVPYYEQFSKSQRASEGDDFEIVNCD